MEKLYKQKEQIRAMKILLNYYSHKHSEPLIYCPLCTIIYGDFLHCDECIWVKETGQNCKRYAKQHNFDLAVSDLRVNRINFKNLKKELREKYQKEVNRWRALRRRQLKAWIKKYDNV